MDKTQRLELIMEIWDKADSAPKQSKTPTYSSEYSNNINITNTRFCSGESIDYLFDHPDKLLKTLQ